MDRLTADAIGKIEQIHSRWIEFEIAGEDHRLIELCASLHFSRRNFSGILEAILFHPAIKRSFFNVRPLVFFAVIVFVFASKRVSTDLSGLGASCSFISG